MQLVVSWWMVGKKQSYKRHEGQDPINIVVPTPALLGIPDKGGSNRDMQDYQGSKKTQAEPCHRKPVPDWNQLCQCQPRP